MIVSGIPNNCFWYTQRHLVYLQTGALSDLVSANTVCVYMQWCMFLWSSTNRYILNTNIIWAKETIGIPVHDNEFPRGSRVNVGWIPDDLLTKEFSRFSRKDVFWMVSVCFGDDAASSSDTHTSLRKIMTSPSWIHPLFGPNLTNPFRESRYILANYSLLCHPSGIHLSDLCCGRCLLLHRNRYYFPNDVLNIYIGISTGFELIHVGS